MTKTIKAKALAVTLAVACTLTSAPFSAQAASQPKTTTKAVKAQTAQTSSDFVLPKSIPTLKVTKSNVYSGIEEVLVLSDVVALGRNCTSKSYDTKISKVTIDGKATNAYRKAITNQTVHEEVVIGDRDRQIYELTYTKYYISVTQGKHTIAVTAGGKTVSQTSTISGRYKAPRIAFKGNTEVGKIGSYTIIYDNYDKAPKTKDIMQYLKGNDSSEPEFYVLKGRTIKSVTVTDYGWSKPKTYTYKPGRCLRAVDTEDLLKASCIQGKIAFTKYILFRSLNDDWMDSNNKIKITVEDNTGAKTTYVYNDRSYPDR